MRWANVNGKKSLAEKGLQGFCPSCGSELRPHCGKIKTNYWSHISSQDCDTWAEPETPWHSTWKNIFLPEEQEVVVKNHRADIKTSHCVVELQHSSISVDEIREREDFYGNMIWVFDCRKQYRKDQILHEPQTKHKEKGIFIQEVWWRWSNPSILACTKPILLHLKKGFLLNIYGFGSSTRLGFGHLITSQNVFLREARKTLGTEISALRSPDHWPRFRPKDPSEIPPSKYDHHEPTAEEIEQMNEWPADEF
jgi:hypothetical protein